MPLTTIRIHNAEDQWESLALALQAVAGWAGLELDYDSLCAAAGLSFMTASTGRDDDCLASWMARGRDACLVEAAALFGLRLREIHPPDAARDLDRAPEFAQHFEASYQPIVRHALKNGQPVLAWGGWADRRHAMWGVITEPDARGIGLAGTTIWSAGRTVPLISPPAQLYVVEEVAPRRPTDQVLLCLSINAARRALHDELGGRWGLVTGPRAYDHWALRLAGDVVCPPCGDGAGRCHWRMARCVASARQTAVRYLDCQRDGAAAQVQPLIDTVITHCRGLTDALAASRDEESVRRLIGSPQGRQALADGVRAAQACERAIAAAIDELHRRHA